MLNYFMHPTNLRNQEQLLELRINEHAAGYGIYIMILELLRDAPSYKTAYKPAHIAFAINEPDGELVRRVCENYGLFTITLDGEIYSQWLIDSMQHLDKKKEQYTNAGKKAAAARWGNDENPTNNENKSKENQSDVNATALRQDESAMQSQCQINKLINITNQPTTTCARMWEVEGGRLLSVEQLENAARCKDTALGEHERSYCEKIKDTDHNTTMIYDISRFFGLNTKQMQYMLIITDNGRVGGRETMELIQTYNRCKSEGFKATFPMSYLLSKFSGYVAAKTS